MNDKQLVLTDLCARLPYKVVVDYGYNAFDVHNGNYVKQGSKCILNCYLLDVFISPRQNEKGEYIKPYLRPMSSMTEEKKEEYEHIAPGIEVENGVRIPNVNQIEWLNKHHFDYRELIKKDLALEAPDGMYD